MGKQTVEEKKKEIQTKISQMKTNGISNGNFQDQQKSRCVCENKREQ